GVRYTGQVSDVSLDTTSYPARWGGDYTKRCQEMIKQDVLNAGYVRLVEYMGGDESVIRNARRCWRSEDKSNERSDRKLIRHLLREGHMTPFETIVFTFDVKCPIFVARQWMRHRIGSFNEESLRYCVAEREYFIPCGLNQKQLAVWKIYNEEQFDRYNLM